RRMSHSPVSIKFKWGLSASDPEQKPVLFVGQAAHLSALTWQDVRCKLEPKVSEEAWRRGINVASPGELCELWPRAASLGVLPPRRSRHAAPARSHALSKLVRSGLRSSADEFVVVSFKLLAVINNQI
ncbi:jg10230, partial [Pararge aegeria aegeria]